MSPRACIVLLLFITAIVARAHNPGLSALAVKIEPATIDVRLTLARADVETLVPLDDNHDGSVSTNEFQKALPELHKRAGPALELALDGLPAAATATDVELDPSDAVHFHFTYSRESAVEMSLRSAILLQLPRGHRQYMTLRDGANRSLGEKILDARDNSFVARLPGSGDTGSGKVQHSFGDLLLLGVKHIATGADHLVFLFGLLIVGGRFRDVVKIITSFTVAHSITLALATLNLIRLSSNIVEPLIAASVMYVGLENIFRRDLERRWMLTFFFGLVHGCGLATALRDLRIGSDGGSIVLPLGAFNLGVELGQLSLAAIVLPIVWQLKKRPQLPARYVPACSVLIALAGGYWLLERVLPIVWH